MYCIDCIEINLIRKGMALYEENNKISLNDITQNRNKGGELTCLWVRKDKNSDINWIQFQWNSQ